MKAMTRADGIAWSRTASSSRMVGDLPPSSSVTRFMVFAPSRMIVSPTATEPVNEILATSGLRTSSAPTTLPSLRDHVQETLRKIGLVQRLHQHPSLARAQLAWLNDDRTAGGDAEASFRQMNSAFAFHAVI